MKSRVLQLAIAAMVVGWLAVYFYRQGLHLSLEQINPGSWATSSALAWMIMMLTSAIVFYARLGRLPGLPTLIFFPICQSISGYLLPFQGSLAFASVYFKRAHGLQIGRTLSINLALVFISITLLGLCGLAIVLTNDITRHKWPIFTLISLAPGSLLLSTRLVGIWLKRSPTTGYRPVLIRAIHQASQTVRHQLWFLLTTPRIILIYVVKIILYTTWFAFLNHSLGLGLRLDQLFYLVLAVEASIIFKVTPGNWGVSQASGGIALTLINAPAQDGILLITTSMISVLILNLVAGYFASRYLAESLMLGSSRNLYHRER